MTEEDRRSAAAALLDNRLVTELLDSLEKSAVDRCITAKLTDHEGRAAYASEARAIRNLRTKLILLCEEAKSGRKVAVA